MGFKSSIVLLTLLAQCAYIRVRAQESEIGNEDIVGGRQLEPREHIPYAAALTVSQTVRSVFCAGSLVSSKAVLTAAHCINDVYDNGLLSTLRVTVGTKNWKSGGQTYEVSRNVTHPKYTETKYDIAFLFLSKRVTFGRFVQPVKLDFDYVGTGVTCKVSGWGYTKTGGDVTDVLYELKVTTIDVDSCVQKAEEASRDFKISAPRVDPRIEICTFHLPNPEKHGTCNGDSGGALVRYDKHTQVGSVSWGFPCARGAPDMYVRFSAFKEFITRHVPASHNCLAGDQTQTDYNEQARGEYSQTGSDNCNANNQYSEDRNGGQDSLSGNYGRQPSQSGPARNNSLSSSKYGRQPSQSRQGRNDSPSSSNYGRQHSQSGPGRNESPSASNHRLVKNDSINYSNHTRQPFQSGFGMNNSTNGANNTRQPWQSEFGRNDSTNASNHTRQSLQSGFGRKDSPGSSNNGRQTSQSVPGRNDSPSNSNNGRQTAQYGPGRNDSPGSSNYGRQTSQSRNDSPSGSNNGRQTSQYGPGRNDSPGSSNYGRQTSQSRNDSPSGSNNGRQTSQYGPGRNESPRA